MQRMLFIALAFFEVIYLHNMYHGGGIHPDGIYDIFTTCNADSHKSIASSLGLIMDSVLSSNEEQVMCLINV